MKITKLYKFSAILIVFAGIANTMFLSTYLEIFSLFGGFLSFLSMPVWSSLSLLPFPIFGFFLYKIGQFDSGRIEYKIKYIFIILVSFLFILHTPLFEKFFYKHKIYSWFIFQNPFIASIFQFEYMRAIGIIIFVFSATMLIWEYADIYIKRKKISLFIYIISFFIALLPINLIVIIIGYSNVFGISFNGMEVLAYLGYCMSIGILFFIIATIFMLKPQ